MEKRQWQGLILNSLKIFAEIVILVLAVFNFVIASMYFIFPKADAKIFKFLGFRRAEESCYKLAYKKSGSSSDLYNLIIYQMDQGDDKEELEYILKLFAAEDYEEFCNKLDESGLASANGKKSLYPYVADTRAFLLGQEVSCKFNLQLPNRGEDWYREILNRVVLNLDSDNLTEYSFNTFMSALYNSQELSKAEKQAIVREIKLTISDSGFDFENLIGQRITKISEAKNSSGVGELRKILLANAEVQMYQGSYYLEVLTYADEGDSSLTSKATDLLESYKDALAAYNKLVA